MLDQIREAGLPEPEMEFLFAKPIGRKWRADFCWPDRKLIFEVEGATWARGRHSRGSGIEGDIKKYNEAGLLGYTVLRGTVTMIESGEALEVVKRALNAKEIE